MKNPKLRATHINQGTTEVTSTHIEKTGQTDKEIQRNHDAKMAKTRQYTKLSDRVAGSDTCIRNWKIPGGEKHFPNEWKMQYVDLYYPYAKGGPLFIDIPGIQHDISRCEKKASACKGLGIRYVYIKQGDGEIEVMARLGDKDAIKMLESRKKAEDEVRERAARNEARA